MIPKMIYRQNKIKPLRERLLLPLLVAVFFVLLFLFVPSSADKLIGVLQSIAYALFSEKSAISKNLSDFRALLSAKSAIIRENEDLKNKLDTFTIRSGELDLIVKENDRLKELWGRKEKPNLLLAGILTRPNRSPYDTFVIDAGADLGIKKGQRVFALGNVLIGSVEYSRERTSLVTLFSSHGNIFEAKVERLNDKVTGGNIVLSVKGQGGGSFTAVAPKNLDIKAGDAVVMSNVSRTIIGYVEKVLVDPRDPFVKVLINSAVPLNSINEVQVEVR